MAIVRLERRLGRGKAVFMVNLTVHPTVDKGGYSKAVFRVPPELGKEHFDVDVREGRYYGTAETSLPIKADSMVLPENELLWRPFREATQPENLKRRMDAILSPSEKIDAAMITRAVNISAKKESPLWPSWEGDPREIISDKIYRRMDTERTRKGWLATGLGVSAAAGGAAFMAAAGNYVRKWTLPKGGKFARRKFLRSALLGGGLCAAGFVAGKGSPRHGTESKGTTMEERGSVSEKDAEFLRSRLEAELFPTVIITGRSAIIAEGAVDSAAKAIAKKIRSGNARPETKVIINIGARHADIVPMLRNDGLRRRKLDWFKKALERNIDSSIRELVREIKSDFEERGIDVGKLRRAEAEAMRHSSDPAQEKRANALYAEEIESALKKSRKPGEQTRRGFFRKFAGAKAEAPKPLRRRRA